MNPQKQCVAEPVIPGRSLAFKIRQNAFPAAPIPLGVLTTLPTPLGAFCASILALLALSTRCIWCLNLGDIVPQIFSSSTAPGNKKSVRVSKVEKISKQIHI